MKPETNSSSAPDLQLAFNVGHSSIGWAVLQSVGRASARAANPSDLNILGCGAVIFRADDCLASSRRTYRRQRRHIRSTKQRIERMAALLFQLLKNESSQGTDELLKELPLYRNGQNRAELTKAGTKKDEFHPWQLAARVLCGDKLLTWPELWDVLRWYAHNRGYDGNQRWSNREVIQDFSANGLRQADKPRSEDEENLVATAERADAESGIQNDADSDVKKVKEAFKQMRDYGTMTTDAGFAEISVLHRAGSQSVD